MEFLKHQMALIIIEKWQRDTILASQIQSNMLMVRMNVKDYLVSNSQRRYWTI